MCQTDLEAKTALQKISASSGRIPIGIYDAKTELFEWEPTQQQQYNQSGIDQQGQLGEEIITIVQAIRRRDSHWQQPGRIQTPSFFA